MRSEYTSICERCGQEKNGRVLGVERRGSPREARSVTREARSPGPPLPLVALSPNRASKMIVVDHVRRAVRVGTHGARASRVAAAFIDFELGGGFTSTASDDVTVGVGENWRKCTFLR